MKRMLVLTKIDSINKGPYQRSGPAVFMVLLGLNCRVARISKGIKQSMLAEWGGISVSALAKFEGGKLSLSIDTLQRIAPHFDINPEMFTHQTFSHSLIKNLAINSYANTL